MEEEAIGLAQFRSRKGGQHYPLSEGMARPSGRPTRTIKYPKASPQFPSGPIEQEKLDSGDETTAHEIFLVESNDGDLYRQQVEPFIHNYARKMKNGTYNRELAIQGLANNLVPNAIRRYKADQGDIGNISVAQKRYIAKEWLPSIEEQAKFEVEHPKVQS